MRAAGKSEVIRPWILSFLFVARAARFGERTYSMLLDLVAPPQKAQAKENRREHNTGSRSCE